MRKQLNISSLAKTPQNPRWFKEEQADSFYGHIKLLILNQAVGAFNLVLPVSTGFHSDREIICFTEVSLIWNPFQSTCQSVSLGLLPCQAHVMVCYRIPDPAWYADIKEQKKQNYVLKGFRKMRKMKYGDGMVVITQW